MSPIALVPREVKLCYHRRRTSCTTLSNFDCRLGTNSLPRQLTSTAHRVDELDRMRRNYRTLESHGCTNEDASSILEAQLREQLHPGIRDDVQGGGSQNPSTRSIDETPWSCRVKFATALQLRSHLRSRFRAEIVDREGNQSRSEHTRPSRGCAMARNRGQHSLSHPEGPQPSRANRYTRTATSGT